MFIEWNKSFVISNLSNELFKNDDWDLFNRNSILLHESVMLVIIQENEL